MVTTSDRTVDMIEEGYRRVIRVDPAAGDALVDRPFLHVWMLVVAAARVTLPAGGAVPALVGGGDPARSCTVRADRSPYAVAPPSMLSVVPVM